MLFSSTWRRPSSIEFPRVWKTFEKSSKDGRILKFAIQDLTEDRYEDMFELFLQYVEDEPWTVSTGLTIDVLGLAIFKDYLLKHWLPQNMTVICVLNEDESEDRSVKPKIVGFNLIAVKCKSDECDIEKYFDSEALKTFLKVADYFSSCCPNVFEKYNVDKIITSIGLCVDREYRLLGISTEILLTRSLLCSTFNIPVSMTLFSAKGSQKAAHNAGFKEERYVSHYRLRIATGIDIQSNTNNSKMMTLVLKDKLNKNNKR